MAQYYIDFKFKKGRLVYNTPEERDADFTMLVDLLKARYWSDKDISLERVDVIKVQRVGYPDVQFDYEWVQEKQNV